MTWQRSPEPDGGDDGGDGGDEEPPARPAPWRAGAIPSNRPVVDAGPVEKWDTELPVPTRSQEAAAALRSARSQVGPTTIRILNLAAFAAAVIGAAAGLAVAWMHVLGDPLADAHAYYEAASRLNAGQPLYPAGADPDGNRIYLYPPLLAVLLRPLALLPFGAFALLWELFVVAAFVALVGRLGVRRRSTWIAIGILGVPIGWALSIAQAHVPYTLLLAIGQPWSIAVAANLKLTPALIALWWLGRRDYQSFFAFLIWLALLAIAQLVVAFDSSTAFFGSVGADQIGHVRNLSPFDAESPWLWLGLVLGGALVTLGLARTRWGWAAAVTLATFSPPRLLVYMLMGLLAGLREPRQAGSEDPDDRSDPVAAYARAVR